MQKYRVKMEFWNEDLSKAEPVELVVVAIHSVHAGVVARVQAAEARGVEYDSERHKVLTARPV